MLSESIRDQSPGRETSPTAIFVVGMHRSGTSAVTRLINLLGMPIVRDEDLYEPRPANPKGYWESKSLIAFNDQLLERLGGSAWTPPTLMPGWEDREPARSLRQAGWRTLRRAHPTRGWVWKDPRNCLTLPFWRKVVQPDLRVAAVLVRRPPVESALSLRARDGVSVAYGLALWESYMRHALSALAGMPTFVTDYTALFADLPAWLTDVRTFLRELGVTTNDRDASEFESFIDARLRRQTAARHDMDALTGSQRSLLALVTALPGVMTSFPVLRLPVPDPGMEEVLRRGAPGRTAVPPWHARLRARLSSRWPLRPRPRSPTH